MLCAFGLYIVDVHLFRNNPRFLIILTFGIQIRFYNKVARSERIPCAGSYYYKCSISHLCPSYVPMSPPYILLCLLLCPYVKSLFSLPCPILMSPSMSPMIPSYVCSPYSLCLLYVPSYVSSLYPLLYPILYPSYVPSCAPSLCPLLCLLPISPLISLPTSDLYLPSYACHVHSYVPYVPPISSSYVPSYVPTL